MIEENLTLNVFPLPTENVEYLNQEKSTFRFDHAQTSPSMPDVMKP